MGSIPQKVFEKYSWNRFIHGWFRHENEPFCVLFWAVLCKIEARNTHTQSNNWFTSRPWKI